MNLACPWALVLCGPVLLAGWVAWRRHPPALPLPTTRPLQRDRRAERRRRLPLALEIASGLLLALAVARPQRVQEVRREARQAVDIMLVLDVSGSMDAVDLPMGTPAAAAAGRPTRLAYARLELDRFMTARPEDRFGLVVFARKPYPACPLTFDQDLLRSRLNAVTTDLLDDGTGLTPALALAALQLRASPSPHRVMVLLTDGRNNVPSEQPPTTAASLAARQGISVHVVGVGSVSAVLPVQTVAGLQYRPVETAIDEPGLRAIAAQGGGIFLPAGDATGFAAAMDRIDSLEKGRVVHAQARPRQELFGAPALVALGLLSIAFVLSQTTCRSLP